MPCGGYFCINFGDQRFLNHKCFSPGGGGGVSMVFSSSLTFCSEKLRLSAVRIGNSG